MPDNNDTGKSKSTGIFKSDPVGPTTSMPMLRPWSYTSVNWPHVSTVSAAKPAVAVDADGWHEVR
jgi:hypothetical protein